MASKYFMIIMLFLCFSSAFAQEWETSLASAQALAKKQDKNIILVFSGSDWCAPCIKLEERMAVGGVQS